MHCLVHKKAYYKLGDVRQRSTVLPMSKKVVRTYPPVPDEKLPCCNSKTVINRSVQETHWEASNNSEQGGSSTTTLKRLPFVGLGLLCVSRVCGCF